MSVRERVSVVSTIGEGGGRVQRSSDASTSLKRISV
jgi:hypothetical protein